MFVLGHDAATTAVAARVTAARRANTAVRLALPPRQGEGAVCAGGRAGAAGKRQLRFQVAAARSAGEHA